MLGTCGCRRFWKNLIPVWYPQAASSLVPTWRSNAPVTMDTPDTRAKAQEWGKALRALTPAAPTRVRAHRSRGSSVSAPRAGVAPAA